MGFAVLLLAVPSLWGALRIREGRMTRDGQSITVALIQGNVPQGEKWDPAHAATIFSRYLGMTREAAAAGAKFILWPESATPFYFDEHAQGAEQVRRTVREGAFWLLFGSDHLTRGTPDRTYNAAYMLDDHGATSAIYHKNYLVPFGEYVPFGSILTFVGPLVEAVAAFSAGEEVTMMPVNGHMVSTAICYEVVYPHLIRQGVLNGSELLTTITNDAWYGESSAPFQHFELATMRAISGIVDPYGRVLARTELFETKSVLGEARFRQERTLYAKIGDLPAQLAVLLTIVGVGVSLARRRTD
jgi:apolipoprotein N-acyltransferase